MSVKKFKFVSPGIFLSEVDNSQLPAIKQAVGPVIIGRTRMGPSMRPVMVESPSEFIQVFGNPVPGGGAGGDVWRAGNLTGPTYAAYAAMAYLKANVGPITMVRLLGEDNPDNSGTGNSIALAGWKCQGTFDTDQATNGGAYGLFIVPSASAGSAVTGTLGAVLYCNEGALALNGTTVPSDGSPATITSAATGPFALSNTLNFVLGIDGLVTDTPTIVATAKTSETTGFYPFVLADLETLTLSVNGGPTQTVTFNTADFVSIGAATAAEVAAVLNADLEGVSVTVSAGPNVLITTDREGSSASISEPAGTGAVALGFPASTPGADNVADVDAVTNTELAALIQAALTAGASDGTAVLSGGFIKITGVVASAIGEVDVAAGTGLAAAISLPIGTVNGSDAVAGVAHEGACALFEDLGSDAAFRLSVYGPTDVTPWKASFNFNRDSNLFIRNVLNTNPQLTNGDFVDTDNLKSKEQYYWLGETFETDINELLDSSADTRAVLIPMGSGSSAQKDEYKMDFQYAKTGYFFSQDLSTDTGAYRTENMVKLFRAVSLDGGRWTQNNLKISINSIKASTNTSDPYGSFNLVVRAASDRDNVVQVVEQFTNLNLNPSSENFIGRVIGDTYYEFDYTQRRLRQYGQYVNKSKYIRIDMNPDIESGLMDARLLPFGCTGPLRFKTVEGNPAGASYEGVPVSGPNSFLLGSGSVPLCDPPEGTLSAGNIWVGSGSQVLSGLKLNFPEQLLRLSASDGGLADPEDAYFGPMSTVTRASSRKDGGWGDYMWRKPEDVDAEDTLSGITSDLVEYSWAVSLDDVITDGTPTSYWQSGSRALGTSTTAVSSSWQSILDAGYDRITAPLYGGFDGLDITEAEPFRDGLLDTGGNLDTANYAFNSIKRAIDTVKDPEFVECNILSIPGVTNASLTQHLVDTCEDRADALAVIDLPNVYTPFTDSDETFQRRNSFTISECVNDLKERGINSSYACTYYPWVQVLDTISNQLLWMPPSVVAIGTLASSEAKSEVWFAPAGFNRGGLTEGAAGWPVTNVTKRLTSKDRDSLYEANINPIATFPSEGIVVFGQKTLQVTRSALDRINVRRLLIFIKKQVSRISSGILFDQNVQVTWNRFLGEVKPFLASVQSRLGLSEWKVILDDTTTTPDLVDQNIMYAKIFLKPARAIEFIAVDFVITRTGASFDD
jgi:hypothetical protein